MSDSGERVVTQVLREVGENEVCCRYTALLAALDALVAQVERDRPIQHVAVWMWLDELKAILRQHR